jgi:hypothetical protein
MKKRSWSADAALTFLFLAMGIAGGLESPENPTLQSCIGSEDLTERAIDRLDLALAQPVKVTVQAEVTDGRGEAQITGREQ